MEARFENDVDDMLKLVQEKLAERPTNAEDADGSYSSDAVDAEEEQDIWGGEEASQYIEDEFDEGGDDFEPILDIDEGREPQD